MNILSGKRIVLGVTGSIAAYKAAALASQLTQQGALLDVIMTEAAQHFVTPLTFQALTGRPVYTNLWDTDSPGGMGTHIAHVGLAHQADLLLIAPITANSLAKLALGLADELLSITALAAACPVLVAPAMDAGMYDNPATQSHVAALKERGVHFAGPISGRMASGFEGLGRFIEPEVIIGHCRVVLGKRHGRLAGSRIVVSAGPTREELDPVRYLTNKSSGKQGFAVAQAALDAGADVILVTGPVGLQTPVGAQRVDVLSTLEMQDAVLEYSTGETPADALIMSSAVSDFRPAARADQKIKKGESDLQLLLTRNPDILLEVSNQAKRPRIVVGFAAESQDLLQNAASKLARKKLDLIVANDITATDAGFQADTNRVYFVTSAGEQTFPLMDKTDVGSLIIDWVADRLQNLD